MCVKVQKRASGERINFHCEKREGAGGSVLTWPSQHGTVIELRNNANSYEEWRIMVYLGKNENFILTNHLSSHP